MELQDFIEKSIKDITSAIHNSNKKMIEDQTGKGISDLYEIKISFDIAVTAGESSEKTGNGKINVLGLVDIGGTVKSGNEKQEVSRITFEVPVILNTIGSGPIII